MSRYFLSDPNQRTLLDVSEDAAMMSNVLGINSAVEHQTIAGEIEKLIQGRPVR